MTFNETIQSMGYAIKEKEDEKIIIEKKIKNMSIAVVFNTELKYINAMLIPGIINSSMNMKELNDAWEHLKLDVATFRLHSGYRILNVL